MHISDSIRPITLILASLERSFPPAEAEYRRCQFWSKVMMSEVEERPRLITGCTAVNGLNRYIWHGKSCLVCLKVKKTLVDKVSND